MFWLGFSEQGTPENARPDSKSDRPESQPESQEEQPNGAGEANAIVLAILPWAVSLLLHVAIVLLAIFLVWSVKFDLDPEEFIVPDARLSKTPGVPLLVRKRTDRKSSTSRRSVSRARSESTVPIQSTRSEEAKVIGAVGAAGGRASPFGTSIRSGSGLDVGFYGTGGNARKIAYVIDASGSLIDSLDFVINELKRSINDLSEQQHFAVFFFQGDRVVEVPPPGMKRATAESRDKVIRWIDLSAGNITAAGKTEPLRAIKRGLAYRPQLLFLLSDNITGRGIYQIDQHQLLRAINVANKHRTKINTIQFLYPDPLEEVGLKPTMQLIASSTGGRYKFVDGRELGIE